MTKKKLPVTQQIAIYDMLNARCTVTDEGVEGFLTWRQIQDVYKAITHFPEEHPYKTGDKVWYLNGLYTLEDDGKHYILTSLKERTSTPIVHLDYGDEDYWLLPYEEPVSIDFEQELYKHFGQVKDFTLGMRIAKFFYDMGRQQQ